MPSNPKDLTPAAAIQLGGKALVAIVNSRTAWTGEAKVTAQAEIDRRIAKKAGVVAPVAEEATLAEQVNEAFADIAPQSDFEVALGALANLGAPVAELLDVPAQAEPAAEFDFAAAALRQVVDAKATAEAQKAVKAGGKFMRSKIAARSRIIAAHEDGTKRISAKALAAAEAKVRAKVAADLARANA